MTDITPSLKDTLQRYLSKERKSLLATLDGLDERQIRWPLTPTGTNLLGLVKHTASVSLGYFGETFGRDLILSTRTPAAPGPAPAAAPTAAGCAIRGWSPRTRTV